ncbi:EF-hand domain-containing protein [Kitasatospora sp. NPDC049285]|uniref:EF-hand domain-containing protein n=1 Tax=Kitasatospora sp. NPDC049285 TaxID=3157096 RepID=UPI003439E677
MADIDEARQAFARLDLDGDGRITAAEHKAVMAQLGDFNVTETVAQAIIARRDANGDGKLSFEEFYASLGD